MNRYYILVTGLAGFYIALLLYHYCYALAVRYSVYTGHLVLGNCLKYCNFTVLLPAFWLINCTIFDLVIFMASANIVIFYLSYFCTNCICTDCILYTQVLIKCLWGVRH